MGAQGNGLSDRQIKLFFNVLAFVTQNTMLFEELLIDLPAQDRAKVLLAGTIIENCGLAKIKAQLQTAAVNMITTKETWLPVRNQYIFQDHVWLFPVLRAIDPNNAVFKQDDDSMQLIEALSEDLGIRLKTENETVMVDMARVFELICESQVYASKMGFNPRDVDSIFRNIFDEKGLDCIKVHTMASMQSSFPAAYPKYDPQQEFSSAISFLLILIAVFVSTGLVIGYHYS